MKSIIKNRQNKKAQVQGLFYLGLFIMVIIVLSLIVMIGSGVLTFVGGQINDITSTLGMVDDTNLSAASDVSIGVVNNGIQMLGWGSGIILFFGIFGILLFALSVRMNPSGFLIGLYIFMVMMFIISAVYVSDTYESFRSGTDDIALELQGMTMGNFIMLNLGAIITVISFVGGIIIFTGIGQEQF